MDPAWRDETNETAILSDISLDEPWSLIERFSTLVRLSGSADEARAVRAVTDRLSAWGIEHQVHHPTCLISLPGPATLRTLGGDGRSYAVKTPSFSPHTDGAEVEAELIYIPGSQARGQLDLFSEQRSVTDADLRGKVVMTEGLGIVARGFDLAGSGAVAALFINPGVRIHEGITTTTWGSPDLDSLGRTPPVPILAINRPDGEELIERLKAGPLRVAFSNHIDTGWRQIPVIVAEIRGQKCSDEFILFHGHLDSWHVGVGDNATGDATLLELARVFAQHRERLDRTLRIAWWSGHSHGRYAGSTWYADAFAHDIARHCRAHINVDSPGCRWATVYEEVSWMAEAQRSFCENVIRDVTGQESTGEGHVLRAGDCSFNNLGVTTYFMLSSTMPRELLLEKGYHPVGGCGGNIAWHTEDDTLEIADRDNLLRDLRVYATLALRSLNAPIAPYDYRAAIDEMADAVQDYQTAAGDQFDLSPTLHALAVLRGTLDRFYQRARQLNADSQLRAANDVQRKLGRILVNLSYTRDGRFRQDPARAIPAVPDLAIAQQLPDADDQLRPAILNSLVRGQNRVIWELEQALEVVR